MHSQEHTVEEMIDSIMICVCKDRGGKELCMNCGKPTVKAQVRKIIHSLHHSHTEEIEQARREALAREKQIKDIHTVELDAIACMSIEQFVVWRDRRKQRPTHTALNN